MLCWCVWFAVLGTLLLSEQLSKDRFQFVSFLGRRGGSRKVGNLNWCEICTIFVTGSEKTAHLHNPKQNSDVKFFLPNWYLQNFVYTHAKFERLEALLKGGAHCLKADT